MQSRTPFKYLFFSQESDQFFFPDFFIFNHVAFEKYEALHVSEVIFYADKCRRGDPLVLLWLTGFELSLSLPLSLYKTNSCVLQCLSFLLDVQNKNLIHKVKARKHTAMARVGFTRSFVLLGFLFMVMHGMRSSLAQARQGTVPLDVFYLLMVQNMKSSSSPRW